MKKKRLLKFGLIAGLLAAMALVSGCVAPAGEPTEGFNWTYIIILALIFGMFYFVLIRPQRKRQKEHQQLMQELQRGDRVVTAGGIYGQIESLSEDNVVIKVESGATLRVARASVVLKRER